MKLFKDNDDDDDNKPLKHEGWDDIKKKSRGFTDCFFFILLIINWIVTTGIGFVALGYVPTPYLKPGNYHRLTNALDYNGKLCGYDANKEKNLTRIFCLIKQ